MPKKDINKGNNIELYRKRLGKQGYQNNKKRIKSMKDVADAKQSAIGIKDVILLLIAMLVFLVAIYGLFYFAYDVDVDFD